MEKFASKLLTLFAVISCVYMALAFACATSDSAYTRWVRGIPNWSFEHSAGSKIQQFQQFCDHQQAQGINVIIGSSTSLHAIDPVYLGPTWFNASTRGQNLLVSATFLQVLKAQAQARSKIIDTLLIDVYPEFQQQWVVAKQDAIEDMVQSLPLEFVVRHSFVLLTDGAFRKLHARMVLWIRNKLHPESSQFASPLLQWGYEPLQPGSFSSDGGIPWSGSIDERIDFALIDRSIANVVLFHNPPTLHPCHWDSMLESIQPRDSIECINGQAFLRETPKADFADDHHMNDDGAKKYSQWLKVQLNNLVN